MIGYFFILVTLIFAYYFSKWRNLPPGPWGLPVLGYLAFLNPKAPQVTLLDLSQKYGSIFGLQLGNVYTVVLSDSKMITSAFSNNQVTGRAPLYLTHGIMQGYGLICAEGDLWRVHRKFALKCINLFGGGKVGNQRRENLESLILKEANEVVESVKQELVVNSEVNLFGHLQHGIGSILNAVVFGKVWEKDDPTWKWLQHLQEEGTKAIGVAGPLNFLPFLRHLQKFKNLMSKLLDGKEKTHELYKQLIEEEKQRFDATNPDILPKNFIQAYLREKEITSAGDLFSDAQFYHFLADIFGAGLDTTLTTISWFTLYMASNPKYQEEMYNEIDLVLQGQRPAYENVLNMPFTQACLAETQRIRSVIPTGIPHATTEDVELFGFKIPKGAMIMPFQWGIHMNPTIWKNPDEFNPRRFIDSEGRFVKHRDWIPFQTGKRMCIGDEFANMILFLFATTLVSAFKLNPLDNQEIDLEGEIGITLTPKQQKLVLTNRH